LVSVSALTSDCILEIIHLDRSEIAYIGSHGTSIDGKNGACGCNVNTDGCCSGVACMDALDEIRATVHAESKKPPLVLRNNLINNLYTFECWVHTGGMKNAGQFALALGEMKLFR